MTTQTPGGDINEEKKLIFKIILVEAKIVQTFYMCLQNQAYISFC